MSRVYMENDGRMYTTCCDCVGHIFDDAVEYWTKRFTYFYERPFIKEGRIL